MSAFRIGQRVRIVGCINPRMRCHVGNEDVIAGPSRTNPGEWKLVKASHADNGNPCSWHECRLEPIVDDGRQVISWADMAGLWQPEGVPA